MQRMLCRVSRHLLATRSLQRVQQHRPVRGAWGWGGCTSRSLSTTAPAHDAPRAVGNVLPQADSLTVYKEGVRVEVRVSAGWKDLRLTNTSLQTSDKAVPGVSRGTIAVSWEVSAWDSAQSPDAEGAQQQDLPQAAEGSPLEVGTTPTDHPGDAVDASERPVNTSVVEIPTQLPQDMECPWALPEDSMPCTVPALMQSLAAFVSSFIQKSKGARHAPLHDCLPRFEELRVPAGCTHAVCVMVDPSEGSVFVSITGDPRRIMSHWRIEGILRGDSEFRVLHGVNLQKDQVNAFRRFLVEGCEAAGYRLRNMWFRKGSKRPLTKARQVAGHGFVGPRS